MRSTKYKRERKSRIIIYRISFTEEVPGTHALSEVKFPLAVEAQDVLKYPGRPIKVEFPSL